MHTQTRNTILLAMLLGASLSHGIAAAQVCDPQQIAKLLASDGGPDDDFGGAIAIADGIVAVGAGANDNNGVYPGSAHLFDAATGQQLHALWPDDGMAGSFGWSISIADDIVAVGDYSDDDNGTSSGSGYLFDAATGEQIHKLLPRDGARYDSFGWSIAIAEGIVAVGAYGDDDNGSTSGSAYLFDAATGDQLFKLLPGDGVEGQRFGDSVAIADGIVAVGAPNDHGNGILSGAAYLFDAATGQQLHKLLPDDGEAGENFGECIAISNGVVAVGLQRDADNGFLSGSAYLFDAATGDQLIKLLPDDGGVGEQFGSSIAIADGMVAVGAWHDDDNGTWSGSAYLFDAATGQQLHKLLADDGADDDYFGHSVAIADGLVAVGAPHDDDNGDQSGSAYVFDLNCGPTLRMIGECPGRIGFAVEGAQANARVAFLYARGEGAFEVPPGNPCAGTVLGLNRTVQLADVVRADLQGVAVLDANVSSAACGRLFVQAVDLSSCATSNVAGIE